MLTPSDFDYSPSNVLRHMFPYVVLTILLMVLTGHIWVEDLVFLWVLLAVFLIYAGNLVMLFTLGTGEKTSNIAGRIFLCNLAYSGGLTLLLLLFGGLFRDTERGVLFFAAAAFGLLIATFFITTLSFLTYYLIWRKRPARDPWTWKPVITSVFLLVCLFGFGFFTDSRQEEKGIVRWSERQVNWDDFYQVSSIEGGYDASIYSGIASPDVLTDSNPSIYAYMDPDYSEKLEGMEAHDDVLRHEQYHFNITEYCARLMRKEVVETGLGGLSTPKLKEIHQRYYLKLDSLQDAYDTETDHSVKYHRQQAWEAQIDDWLRQTANFAEENMFHYHRFVGGGTQYYKHIYFTLDQELLTSVPVGAEEFAFGETYQVEYSRPGVRTVTFYKDGVIANGGYFGTAVVELKRKKGGIIELHYKNQDKVYTQELLSAIIRTQIDSTGIITTRYYNDKDERIDQEGVYELTWRLQPDSTYLSSSRNIQGELVPKKGDIYFEERRLDKRGRTIYSRNLDKTGRPVLDEEFVASREWEFNDKNQRIRLRKFDTDGAPAYHLSDYHLTYEHDAYGKISKVSSFDEEGNPTYDNNGASIYQYTYDLQGRETSIKRFNAAGDPIVANDDYFMKVYEYQQDGKLGFEASYYPGYVLKFTDDRWGATRYAYEGDSITLQYNYDAYGNQMTTSEQVAVIKKVMNDDGHVVRKIYLDTLGLPMAISSGVAEHRYTYDNQGNVLATKYYDTEEEPVALEGTHKISMEYNAQGLVSAVHEYDLDDNLVPGVATTRYVYNDYGTQLEELYFDRQGRRTRNDSGISGLRYILNKRDYAIAVVNIDNRGRITNNNSGYALQRRQLNELGHLVSLAYYDDKSRPVSGPSGYHKLVYDWAPVGEIEKIAYFDTSLNPTSDSEGTAIYEYTLAPSGMDLEIRRLNTSGELADNHEGTAVSKYAETQNGPYYLYEELNSSGEVVFEDNDYRFGED